MINSDFAAATILVYFYALAIRYRRRSAVLLSNVG